MYKIKRILLATTLYILALPVGLHTQEQPITLETLKKQNMQQEEEINKIMQSILKKNKNKNTNIIEHINNDNILDANEQNTLVEKIKNLTLTKADKKIIKIIEQKQTVLAPLNNPKLKALVAKQKQILEPIRAIQTYNPEDQPLSSEERNTLILKFQQGLLNKQEEKLLEKIITIVREEELKTTSEKKEKKSYYTQKTPQKQKELKDIKEKLTEKIKSLKEEAQRITKERRIAKEQATEHVEKIYTSLTTYFGKFKSEQTNNQSFLLSEKLVLISETAKDLTSLFNTIKEMLLKNKFRNALEITILTDKKALIKDSSGIGWASGATTEKTDEAIRNDLAGNAGRFKFTYDAKNPTFLATTAEDPKKPHNLIVTLTKEKDDSLSLKKIEYIVTYESSINYYTDEIDTTGNVISKKEVRKLPAKQPMPRPEYRYFILDKTTNSYIPKPSLQARIGRLPAEGIEKVKSFFYNLYDSWTAQKKTKEKKEAEQKKLKEDITSREKTLKSKEAEKISITLEPIL